MLAIPPAGCVAALVYLRRLLEHDGLTVETEKSLLAKAGMVELALLALLALIAIVLAVWLTGIRQMARRPWRAVSTVATGTRMAS